MKKILCFITLALMGTAGFAQTVTLTFTGQDAGNQYVQLDRVSVTNLTKDWQETLIWPDTTLTMQNGTGIDEISDYGSFGLSQNTPNPFNGITYVNLTVADAGTVTLDIVDGNGRIVATRHGTSRQCGTHQFRISMAAAGTYVLTARQNGKTSSIKMVCNGGGNGNGIEYAGIVGTHHGTSLRCATPKSPTRGITTHPFNFGDIMKYVGFATINDTEVESLNITQAQNASQTFVLLFSSPCNGTPTVTDIDGNVYNTVQIGSQCWMKENLRTTKYADNTFIPKDGSYSLTEPYRYAPDNDSLNVPTYGYLYNWPAVMHGTASSSTNPSGVQGICPMGWHVPSNAEWTQLTDYVSSISEYVCGSDNSYIAKALAAATGWYTNDYTAEIECAVANDQSSNNSTGFSAMPAGIYNGDYIEFGNSTFFWSSTMSDINSAYCRHLAFTTSRLLYDDQYKGRGFSVRCVRD